MLELDHINLPVRSLPESRAFYEAVLIPFGLRVVRDFGDVAIGFGHRDYAVLALIPEPHDIRPAHVAFRTRVRTDVDRFYLIALEAGARDNGAPGLREHYHANYYGAFVLDPDGHNLEFVCHEPSPN